MTREETVKILAILKAAYPNSYKGMTKEEANGTITVWSMQFYNIPANVILIAINKIISTSPFVPSISEVKTKLKSMYYECMEMLNEHKYATEGFKISDDPNEEPAYFGTPLDSRTLETVKEIIRVTEPLRSSKGTELTLSEMLKSNDNYLLNDNKECSEEKLKQIGCEHNDD